MPYIKKSDRHEISGRRPTREPANPGELNYSMTVVVQKFLKEDGLRYSNINYAIGLIEKLKYCLNHYGSLPVIGEYPYPASELKEIVTEYIKTHPRLDAIGALECMKLELYRRIAAPYEDEKINENGDVNELN